MTCAPSKSTRPALAALARAAGEARGPAPGRCEARDLFRRPLRREELASFDAVVFDPPRAGALAQSRELAASAVPTVVAISCNAASFARDMSILAAGGYRLESVAPIDQFRFSPHVEIVGVLRKPPAGRTRADRGRRDRWEGIVGMTDAAHPPDVLAGLAAIVGAAHVVTDPDLLAGHLVEPRGLYQGRALALVRPDSTAQTAAVAAFCTIARVPIVPQGGNTGLVGGQIPDASGGEIVLSLQRHEPGARGRRRTPMR